MRYTQQCRRQVDAWLNAGILCPPSPSSPDLVHLARVLAERAGLESAPEGAALATVRRALGAQPQTTVVVLVDGMGSELLRRHSNYAPFLSQHVVMDLRSVFPSATAPALTALATGRYPCEHSVSSWWIYMPDRQRYVVSLPAVERFTDRPISEIGVALTEIAPLPSFWPGAPSEVFFVFPKSIQDSEYTRYFTGERPVIGYEDLQSAIASASSQALAETDAQRLVYVYISYLDSLCHAQGTDTSDVQHLLGEIDAALRALSQAISGRAQLVVTADHGHTTLDMRRQSLLHAFDPLSQVLIAPPSGEPTVPMFHVKPGREQWFYGEFIRHYGDCFRLLSPEDVEDLRLLGPQRLSPVVRERLGTFVGISSNGATLNYVEPNGTARIARGGHGGLRRSELEVPLIVV